MTDQQSGPRRIGRRRNYLESLRGDLQDLQGSRALISELIQNADDAVGATQMRFEVTPDALIVWNDAEFTRCSDIYADECSNTDRPRCDFHSFRDVSGAAKRERDDTTGAFGIGFTSVYQITDQPVLTSAGERWTIDESRPEGQQIEGRSGETTDGTTFILPWASDPSPLREAFGQVPVTDDLIHQMAADLLEVVPEALLFLRRLDVIEVVTASKSVVYERDFEGEITTIAGSDGSEQRWLLLPATLGEVGAEFRSKNGPLIQPDRRLELDVAVRLDEEQAAGKYFVTLPTEELTRLPISVNGSFFPKRDRKSVLIDGTPRGEWNRMIVAEAARCLGDALERVNGLVEQTWIVRLLQASKQVHDATSATSRWHPDRIWWPAVQQALPAARVVPTCFDELGTIADVLVWSADEVNAADALREVGIRLVAPTVRSEWYSLLSIGIPVRPLRLSHVTEALPTDPTPLLGKLLQQVWALIEHLLGSSTGSNPESRTALDRIALWPHRGGALGTATSVVRAPKGTRDLLDRSGTRVPLLDPEFESMYPNLAGRVRPVGPAQMLGWLSEAFREGRVREDFDRRQLLGYFAERADDAASLDRGALAMLPIFPTGAGFRPLPGLVMPVAGFRDPIGAAEVIDLQGLSATSVEFLHALEVPQLDLEHFCSEVLPAEVDAGLDTPALERVVQFLAQNLSLISERSSVRRKLQDVPLVRCVDGEYRSGKDVYFGSVSSLVVGEGRPVAEEAGAAHRSLCQWLGVAERPRIPDVLENCRSLAAEPPGHIERATAILEFLDQHQEHRAAFDRLKNDRWLPAIGHRRVARPSQVFTVFRRNIFRGQADFLAIPQRVQQRTRTTLEWLGVRSNPPPELVVQHLRACVQQGKSATSDVWEFLSQHADSDEVRMLASEHCVPVGGGRYALPQECFWGAHPFGRHRYQLSDELRSYQQLFEQLGVRATPGASDAVDVLVEIAVKYGGADRILADDVAIVDACWMFLDHELREERATAGSLSDLRRAECVLDGASRLRRPDQVLFRDSSTMSRLLEDATRARLIDRPENMKRALDAVGVRHLREAIVAQVLVRDPSATRCTFPELVEERMHHVARALGNCIDEPFAALDRFSQNAAVVGLDRLVVAERLEFGGEFLPGPEQARCAVWLPDRSELLLTLFTEATRWGEVAREFALGVGVPIDDLPQAVGALRAVLGAESAEAAERELDDMGYVEVSEAIEIVVEHTAVGEIPSTDVNPTPPPPKRPDKKDTEPVAKPAANLSDPKIGQQADGSPAEQVLSRPPHRSATPEPSAGRKSRGRGTAVPKGRRSAPKISVGGSDRPRDRLLSYVAPSQGVAALDRQDEQREAEEQRNAIDEAAVKAVIEFETAAGRAPTEMPHNHPGYDVLSADSDDADDVRYIEVKGTKPTWDGQGVGLTATQFAKARELGPAYWLYVVEVNERESSVPYRIQDPANRVSRFMFDKGWKDAADSAPGSKALPPVPVVDGDRQRAVPLLSTQSGELLHQFVEWPKGQSGFDSTSELFAVQLADDTAGIGTHGGLAYSERLGSGEAPEEDELVVVRLLDDAADLIEPVCVRYWRLEEDARGAVGVILDAHGAAQTIAIGDLNSVQVLGRVLHIERR